MTTTPEPPMRTLRTGSLTLEPQVVAHAKEMFVLLCDPALYEFENGPPASERWLAERYARLEARRSPDGSTRWLNWVVRLGSGELCGYVQATVPPGREALVAYELGSRYWRQGIGSAAVTAMLAELVAQHGVETAVAVFKRANHRSRGLLKSLGFAPGTDLDGAKHGVEPDESIMLRALAAATG